MSITAARRAAGRHYSNNDIMPHRFVYFFGNGQADGGSEIKHLVGGKGASLADMTRAGLNVPPGFTISAECCDLYFRDAKQWPAGLEDEVRTNLARLEKLAGKSFGKGADPLLVAVRSGAALSMPGMMDTVLNVGLNPDCVQAMAKRSEDPRTAWAAYRDFLVMFGHTVGGIDEQAFTIVISEFLQQKARSSESELNAEELEQLCNRFISEYRRLAGREIPREPWAMLAEAINAVFNSWKSERAIAYRQHHKIERALPGTAVNIQMMCPADVSGIMFTANPVNLSVEQILIESSFGLGEAIVLGKVTPDRFVIDRQSRKVVERSIGAKNRVFSSVGGDGKQPKRATDATSLTDSQVEELVELGLRVEKHFVVPCDIEWAWYHDKFYLLQARPIKGFQRGLIIEKGPLLPNDERDREITRRQEIAALEAKAEPGGTVWSRYNLAEILPEPTPMTWAIVRRFMSGQGGFGLMYRDLGFDPDPELDQEGIYDLVCGRPYCNLSREPRMQNRHVPFEHSFAALKANPAKALYPQPTLNPARAGPMFWLLLPWLTFKLFRSSLKISHLSRTLAYRLGEEVFPTFAMETGREAVQDLSGLDSSALLERLEFWIRRTLVDFARDSLKPTVLAAVALGNLERGLRALGPERTRAALNELSAGARPDPEADLPGALRDLAAGRLERSVFLERFGHRGNQEMELAQPRWAEKNEDRGLRIEDRELHESPLGVPALAGKDYRLKAELQTTLDPGSSVHDSRPSAWERIAIEAKLSASQRVLLEPELQRLHTYLGLRETAKHYLMKGYALIRRILLELDHRYHLDGGIFYLTPEELPGLVAGEDLSSLIEDRRHRRALLLSLEVPQVLFSDDLEAIGRPPVTAGGDTLQGVPLSAGVAEGPALVLQTPNISLSDGAANDQAEGFILVCPSTDPAWVPLFVRARGLVMETGGVLSHGAIVAREFGLPAVAGLPGVHRRLKTGQRLRIDGARGTVSVVS